MFCKKEMFWPVFDPYLDSNLGFESGFDSGFESGFESGSGSETYFRPDPDPEPVDPQHCFQIFRTRKVRFIRFLVLNFSLNNELLE